MTSMHPNDMSAEQLRATIRAMTSRSLDLAQHLNFSNQFLEGEGRDKAFEKAEKIAYELVDFPYNFDPDAPEPNIHIATYGSEGLDVVTGSFEDIMNFMTENPQEGEQQ